jgi:hypothetical protein
MMPKGEGRLLALYTNDRLGWEWLTRRHDTQHYDTQNNDNQHYDILHNDTQIKQLIYDTQHKQLSA